MNLPTLPADKAQHVIYGAAIFSVVALACTALGLGPLARPAGALAALLAGVAKEALDWADNHAALAMGLPPPHSVDPGDVVATEAGALWCWMVAEFTTGG